MEDLAYLTYFDEAIKRIIEKERKQKLKEIKKIRRFVLNGKSKGIYKK